MAKTQSYTSTSPMDVIDGTTLRFDEIDLTDFDEFSLPQTATVNGLQITCYCTHTSISPSIGNWRLSDGTSYSKNTKINELAWPTSTIGAVTAGGQTNLWPTSGGEALDWSPENLEANLKLSFDTTSLLYADAIFIEVFYSISIDRSIKLSSGLIKLTSGKISI